MIIIVGKEILDTMRVFESVLCIERDGQRTFTCADKQSVIFPRIMFGDKSDQSFAISLFLILWIGCDIFEFDRFATLIRDNTNSF